MCTLCTMPSICTINNFLSWVWEKIITIIQSYSECSFSDLRPSSYFWTMKDVGFHNLCFFLEWIILIVLSKSQYLLTMEDNFKICKSTKNTKTSYSPPSISLKSSSVTISSICHIQHLDSTQVLFGSILDKSVQSHGVRDENNFSEIYPKFYHT